MAVKKTDVEEEVQEVLEDKTSKSRRVDVNAYYEELVPFQAFKDNFRYKDDIVVAVNGRAYRIKRGVQVMIPRKVALVLEEQMMQDAATADLIAGKEAEYRANQQIMG